MTITTAQAQHIVDMYRDPKKNPLAMAEAFKQGIAAAGNAAKLERSLRSVNPEGKSIGPGPIYQYVQLLNLAQRIKKALADGKLPFKSARALIPLTQDQQVKFGEPLIKPARISSANVEKFISLCRKHPKRSVDELVASVLENRPLTQVRPPEWVAPVRREPVRITPQNVLKAATELLGSLRACEWDDTPDAMNARLMLRKLEAELPRQVVAV